MTNGKLLLLSLIAGASLLWASGISSSIMNLAQWGGTSTTLGQKAMSASVPIVIASDQSALTVSPDGGATATTTNSALGCYLQSAASTNATNCKASAGNFYGVRAVNTTATLYYLRLYNASGTPTCSSATGFIESIPIPASATGAGIAAITTVPVGYSTGIAFCFTGGGSSTDNTNAATGVYLTIYYK
jgi:hypothetical protein